MGNTTNSKKEYPNETFEEHMQKVDKILSRYDTSKFSEEQIQILKEKASQKIYQDNVNKILQTLVDNLNALPQEEQDAFWNKSKK